MLREISGFLGSSVFDKWCNQSDSRFAWATPALFAKLTSEMLTDIRDELVRGGFSLRGNSGLGAVLAAHLRKAADAYQARHSLQCQGFEHNDYDLLEPEFINAYACGLLCHPNAYRIDPDALMGIPLRQCLQFVQLYAEMRLTLVETTGHAGFEETLSKATEAWILSGYPCDLLGHDAAAIRAGMRVCVHLIRQDQCSTALLPESERPEGPMPNSKVIRYA